MLATYAYAAFFGAREMEITPCIERNEEERRAIYNKYLEEITGYLYFDTGDVHTYEIRKCNLRGIYGGLDRKGTKVDEMPIFKFIDERIEAGIGNWKHRGERRK